jgi:DMSO/TMAO reductase YedYZ molybdopterin-dependent catalytic subunit
MNIRFYNDPETGLPHIYRHGVDENEVEEVLRRPGEDRPGQEGSRVAMGQTRGGRYLRIIYVLDPEPDSVFVITAYELTGKPLTAYRRRRRRRQR